MSSSREEEAAKYLEKHNIMNLMKYLTSMLLFHRPERPREFLVAQLEQLKASEHPAMDKPSLFDESNLNSVFRILDPENNGYISYVQYKEALQILGIKNFSECPEGLDNNRISLRTFKREAKEGFGKSTATL